jgi:hypothetical protein
MPADAVSFDPDRLLSTLHAHGVDYVVVGGFAARAHGASRPTADLDCVPDPTDDNYDRLAAALRDLAARLRVGGMTDDDARRLPVTIDRATLRSFGSSTWMTDAGPIDVLVELSDPTGGRHPYRDLVTRAARYRIGSVVVQLAALEDIVASKEAAGRPKDRDALPELLELLRDRPSR